ARFISFWAASYFCPSALFNHLAYAASRSARVARYRTSALPSRPSTMAMRSKSDPLAATARARGVDAAAVTVTVLPEVTALPSIGEGVFPGVNVFPSAAGALSGDEIFLSAA